MPMFWLRTRQGDQRRIQRQLDQGLFSARSSKLDSGILLLESVINPRSTSLKATHIQCKPWRHSFAHHTEARHRYIIEHNVKARLALPRGKHLIIVSWSARLSAPASLSMLPLGRCLLRSIETSAPRFFCASHSHYSTLSSSHREQVTVPCRSNGHITLRQVVVVVVNSFDPYIPQRIFHKYCWLA